MNGDEFARLAQAVIRERLRSDPNRMNTLLADAEARAWEQVTERLSDALRDAILAELTSSVRAAGEISTPANASVAGPAAFGAPAQPTALSAATAVERDDVADPRIQPRPEQIAGGNEPGENVIYVYGIVDRTDLNLDGILGVAGGRPIRLYADGPLTAVVSDVPTSEFGQEALEAHLSDMGWLERNVRAHQAVLDAVLPNATLVPMKFATVFYTLDGLNSLLNDHADRLTHVLEQLAGKQEWGVKLSVDLASLSEHIATASAQTAELRAQMAGKSQGAAYFMARKLQEVTEAEIERVSFAVADEVHMSLAQCSVGACLNPLGPDDGSDHRLLLNAAFLVATTDETEFQARVAALAAAHADTGFSLALSGPWPPYNFVSSLENAEESHAA